MERWTENLQVDMMELQMGKRMADMKVYSLAKCSEAWMVAMMDLMMAIERDKLRDY